MEQENRRAAMDLATLTTVYRTVLAQTHGVSEERVDVKLTIGPGSTEGRLLFRMEVSLDGKDPPETWGEFLRVLGEGIEQEMRGRGVPIFDVRYGRGEMTEVSHG